MNQPTNILKSDNGTPVQRNKCRRNRL